MFAGLRRPRLRPARLKRAEERHSYKNHCSAPSAAFPFSDCFTAPATGYRYRETGELVGDGTGGHSWSASSLTTDHFQVGSLWFGSDYMGALNSTHRSHALSVRCVQASTRKLPAEGADVAAKNAETHPDPRAAPCAGEEKDLEIRIILSTFVHSATTGFWPSGPGFLFFYVYTEAGNPARKNSSEERRL
jgi:hypothetical protein